jgi:hypothetical protein
MNAVSNSLSTDDCWSETPAEAFSMLPLTTLQRRLRAQLIKRLAELRECTRMLEDADGTSIWQFLCKARLALASPTWTGIGSAMMSSR